MKEVRQIKLALINSDFMTERVRSILDTLDETLGELVPYKPSNFPTYTFYIRKRDDIIVIEYNKETNNFVIDYEQIWKIFEARFNFNGSDILSIIKWYIEKVYNIIDVNIKRSTLEALMTHNIHK